MKHTVKSDADILREYHQFIGPSSEEPTYENKLIRNYDKKLFKDFAIGDLSQHKRGRLGLRWRTEREALIGKGETVCGETSCQSKFELEAFEVLFQYTEQGQKKETLVKLVLCSTCALKLQDYKKNIKQRNRSRSMER